VTLPELSLVVSVVSLLAAIVVAIYVEAGRR